MQNSNLLGGKFDEFFRVYGFFDASLGYFVVPARDSYSKARRFDDRAARALSRRLPVQMQRERSSSFWRLDAALQRSLVSLDLNKGR